MEVGVAAGSGEQQAAAEKKQGAFAVAGNDGVQTHGFLPFYGRTGGRGGRPRSSLVYRKGVNTM
jgi:hypothetical protein